MNKEKLFYDIITWIFILLIIGLIIYLVFLTTTTPKSLTIQDQENLLQKVFNSGKITAWANLYAIFYTIAIIVLIIRKQEGVGHKILMIIISLILWGIAPLVYYFFGLRRKIGNGVDPNVLQGQERIPMN